MKTSSKGYYYLGFLEGKFLLNEYRYILQEKQKEFLESGVKLSNKIKEATKSGDQGFNNIDIIFSVNHFVDSMKSLFPMDSCMRTFIKVKNGEYDDVDRNTLSFVNVINKFQKDNLTILFENNAVYWEVRSGDEAHEDAMQSGMAKTLFSMLESMDSLEKKGKGGYIVMKGDGIMPDDDEERIIVKPIGHNGNDALPVDDPKSEILSRD